MAGDSHMAHVKHKQNDSSCWADLLKIRKYYMAGRVLSLGNGGNIRFWEDVWVNEGTLSFQFPVLYELCNEKEITVKQLCESN